MQASIYLPIVAAFSPPIATIAFMSGASARAIRRAEMRSAGLVLVVRRL